MCSTWGCLKIDTETSEGTKCGGQTSNWGEKVPIYFPHTGHLALAAHSFLNWLQSSYDYIKAQNSLGRWYLAERLLPPSSARVTCSSQAGWLRGLTLREVQKEITRNRAFLAVAPRLWNNLLVEIQRAPSLGIFRRKVKTWLFRQGFPHAVS